MRRAIDVDIGRHTKSRGGVHPSSAQWVAVMDRPIQLLHPRGGHAVSVRRRSAIPRRTVVRSFMMNDRFSNRAFGSSSFSHCLAWDRVAHPGHASLRSLRWPGVGPGRCMHVSDWRWSALLSLAIARVAAAIFGVIHGPRPVRTIPSLSAEGVQFMRRPPTVHDGTRCHPPTCGA